MGLKSPVNQPIEPRNSGQTEQDGALFTKRLFSPLPARYDRLEEILSMGQNARWRREMVDHVVHHFMAQSAEAGPVGGVECAHSGGL